MKKIIFKYLSQNYYIDTSKVGNDGIYRFDDTREFKIPTNGSDLITEIKNIFSLCDNEIFILIYHWSLEQKSNLDLSFYWKTNLEMITNVGNSYYMKYLDITRNIWFD